MKKLILCLIVLLAATRCYADVTAEIIGKSIDENGNIVIKTQYKIDGVEVQSRYPTENGKYYWVTRYNMVNFYGMPDAQIIERIKQDLSQFAKSLITQKFLKDKNSVMVLKDVVGTTITEKTADIQINETTKLEVKTDGTMVEKPVVDPIVE